MPHKPKKLVAFKTWAEAVDSIDAVFARRFSDDPELSVRREQNIFNQGMADFRIRLAMTEFEMRKKRK